MSRKSNWTPGAVNREPGADRDYRSRGLLGPSTRPLDAVLGGIASVVGGIVLLVWGLVILPTLNLPAGIIIGVSSLALLVAGAIALRQGVRRWLWRKRNVAQTGGRYLRPWETTPRSFPGD